MRASWHEIWGSGRGPASRLAPQTRILAGAAFLAACLVSPSLSVQGAVFIVASSAAWILASGIPVRALRSFVLLGLAMFLPYFLLVPLIVKGWSAAGPATSFAEALAGPWSVFLHGLAGLLVTTSTIATLTASDLRQGLLALPFPRVLTAILVQIIHQTSVLLSETNRIAAALAVRGGSGSLKAAVRMLSSLPRVWLPRILGRADRVAAAMELRGFAEADLRFFGQRAIKAPDAAAIAIAGVILAGAVILRLRLL